MNEKRFFEHALGGTGRHPFAASTGLMLYNVFEDAFVTDGTAHVLVGALYGYPTCAAIAKDESWCAVGSAGVSILRAPAGEFLTTSLSRTAADVATGVSKATLWTTAMWIHGPRQVGIVGHWDTGEAVPSMWKLDIDTLALTPLVDYFTGR